MWINSELIPPDFSRISLVIETHTLRKQLPAPALGHVILMETGRFLEHAARWRVKKRLWKSCSWVGGVEGVSYCSDTIQATSPRSKSKEPFQALRGVWRPKKRENSAHSSVKRTCQKVQCSAVLENWRTGLRHPSGAGERMAGGNSPAPLPPLPNQTQIW